VRDKQVDRVREYLRKTPVAPVGSILALVPNREYGHIIVNHLLRRGEIKRVTRGWYTVRDDPSLLVYCLKPAYLGLQDAMSFHGLWEQETVPVVVTARMVRPGVREVLGGNALVRRISPGHFFGYDHLQSGDLLLPVSDPEKTLIDLVYFNEAGPNLAAKFRGRVDRRKLDGYLKRYGRAFRGRVIDALR